MPAYNGQGSGRLRPPEADVTFLFQRLIYETILLSHNFSPFNHRVIYLALLFYGSLTKFFSALKVSSHFNTHSLWQAL